MRDALAEWRLFRVLFVGVELDEISGKAGKRDDIGLGDGSASRDVLGSDCEIFKVVTQGASLAEQSERSKKMIDQARVQWKTW